MSDAATQLSPPIWESDDATVIVDGEDFPAATKRYEGVQARVHQCWVVLTDDGETQAIPRRRVQEVFES